jgi:hypothetical protein
MKLCDKLQIPSHLSDFRKMETGLQLARELPPSPTEFERAWSKFTIASRRFLISLASYYCGELALATTHARECIRECDDFFFGSWRSELNTPSKVADPAYWKREFVWIENFEAALLCGSVLNEWEFLRKVGAFPEPDSFFDEEYRAQDRDLHVAIGGFLRGAPSAEMDHLLEQANSGSKKTCKFLAQVIRTCLDRDASALQKSLVDYLRHYKKNEFPKDYIRKKISIEGTFFVHWAEKEKLSIAIPPELADYIVRLE